MRTAAVVAKKRVVMRVNSPNVCANGADDDLNCALKTQERTTGSAQQQK
jgi:hypothetical protein